MKLVLDSKKDEVFEIDGAYKAYTYLQLYAGYGVHGTLRIKEGTESPILLSVSTDDVLEHVQVYGSWESAKPDQRSRNIIDAVNPSRLVAQSDSAFFRSSRTLYLSFFSKTCVELKIQSYIKSAEYRKQQFKILEEINQERQFEYNEIKDKVKNSLRDKSEREKIINKMNEI